MNMRGLHHPADRVKINYARAHREIRRYRWEQKVRQVGRPLFWFCAWTAIIILIAVFGK